MEAAILAWLQELAIRAFGISLFLMLAIDGAYALVLFATRDRDYDVGARGYVPESGRVECALEAHLAQRRPHHP